jgi:riboflavin kinase/FMN adenylyltransferase
MIMTERAKIRAFEEADVENMFIFTFSRTFAEIDPEVFVREFLVKKLRAAVVIVGYDYHFGRNRSGDFDLLVTLGNKYGFTALRVPKVTCDGETVSSTNIRKFLADGNVEKAGKFLGRPFFVEGEVVKGDGVGRQLGFPTANVDFGNELIPKAGVYVSIARFEGRWLPSATSIGKRPTFNFPEQMKVETYIFDFNESIYGKHMEVDLLHYLREEIKFPSKEALIEAIEQDCLNARNYFKKKLP